MPKQSSASQPPPLIKRLIRETFYHLRTFGRSEIAPSHEVKLANAVSIVDSASYSPSQLPVNSFHTYRHLKDGRIIDQHSIELESLLPLSFHGSRLVAEGSNGPKI